VPLLAAWHVGGLRYIPHRMNQNARLTRRDFLRVGAMAGTGTALGSLAAIGADLRPTVARAQSAIFSLGGATLDNEWNHIQQKLMRGLGIVAIENQARI